MNKKLETNLKNTIHVSTAYKKNTSSAFAGREDLQHSAIIPTIILRLLKAAIIMSDRQLQKETTINRRYLEGNDYAF